jgi:peptidoglycan hydrolase FlgJ
MNAVTGAGGELKTAETGRAAGPASRRPADDPQHVAQAAQQFESLLIGQLLKSMRGSSSAGWLGTGEDSTAGSVMELAEEQLAESLARAGGLGLAKLVVSGLKSAQAARRPDGA